MGHSLARLPIDPRLGRMLLAALSYKCLSDLLIIVSALAVQDPREYPNDKRQAHMKHRRFWHSKSDFLTWVNLWNYYEEKIAESTKNQLRKQCKKDFLSYSKMREWRDLHRQLLLAIKPLVVKNHRPMMPCIRIASGYRTRLIMMRIILNLINVK